VSQTEIDNPGALFARAVATLDSVDTSAVGEPHDEPAWEAIGKLQRTGSRAVLEMCAARCVSLDPRERRVAAAVLGQLGVRDRQASIVFCEERFQALHALLLAEVAGPADARVLAAACIALGHLHETRVISPLAALRAHPEPDVRLAVALGVSGHDTDEAVSALMALSADTEPHVRDWATFGLGQQIDRDTPAIRAALAARLTDPDPDTRKEAFTGLAARGEVMLAQSFSLLPDLTVEASYFRPSQIGDGVWCCEYLLRWPDHEARLRAYGLDGLQALLLAMALTDRTMRVEAAFRRNNDLLPSQTTDPTWFGWPTADALRLGQTGAGDLRARLFDRMDRDDLLDRIVQAECGPRFLKVARVTQAALEAIGHRSRSARLHGEMGDDGPDPLLETALASLARLVVLGVLEVCGDLAMPRYSEVRLLLTERGASPIHAGSDGTRIATP